MLIYFCAGTYQQHTMCQIGSHVANGASYAPDIIKMTCQRQEQSLTPTANHVAVYKKTDTFQPKKGSIQIKNINYSGFLKQNKQHVISVTVHIINNMHRLLRATLSPRNTTLPETFALLG